MPPFFKPLCTALLFFTALPGSAEDWPGFQGPERDGVVPTATILTDWSNNKPPVKWTNPTGPGFGGAAIKNGLVYILDRNGTAGDRLRVFDLEAGEEQWSLEYESPGRMGYHGARTTPMVTDKHAFTIGPFGHITAFDLKKRSIAWTKHMDAYGAFPPKWAWTQSPLIYKDWLIFAPMAENAGLVAVEQDTGKFVWRSKDIGRESYGSPRLVTLAGKEQVLLYTSTLVSGTDPETGEVLWTYDNIPVKRAIPTPAVVGDDRLFITAGYDSGSSLIQIHKQGGAFKVKELKRDKLHGGQIHSALPVGEHLYVNLNTNENLRLRGKDAHGLGCFDADGRLVWKNDNKPDINRGAVIAIDAYLLTLGGEDGVLRVIEADPSGYKELGSVKVFPADKSKNMIWAPMAYADGYLLVRSQSQLRCLDLRPDRLSEQR
ncbi:MAG: PQQ-binding-like beta-propeller repeat protein [Planctomycetota bacterium]